MHRIFERSNIPLESLVLYLSIAIDEENEAIARSLIANEAIARSLIANEAIARSLIVDEAIARSLIVDEAIARSLIVDEAIARRLIVDEAIARSIRGWITKQNKKSFIINLREKRFKH